MSQMPGHSLSPESVALLDRLAALAQDLLAELQVAADLYTSRTPSTGPTAADNVERYLAMITDGVTANDATIALRGTNLLTTVNKGIADAEQSPADRPISEKAFAVTRAAIAAARSLRADVGMDF